METIKTEPVKTESNIENLTKNSKETEEVPVDEFERINLGETDEKFDPFMLVGRPGEYTLVLGNTAIWDEKIKTIEQAKEILVKMPWKLVLIASKVYSEYVNEYIKKANEYE